MKSQLAQVKWNTLLAVLFFIHLFSSVTFGQGDKCIKVVDGDTIIITYQGMMEKVRLIGVDTPETVHPKKPVEYFAQEASAFTRSLVEGKDVPLEFDWQKRDKYRRLLAYVYLTDGTMLNRRIIEAGYGHAYTKYPFKYLDDFRKAEKQAREEGKGLWGPYLPREPDKTADLHRTIVYVTKTGKKYHRESCRCLPYSKIQVKLRDASKRGFGACKICNPPKLAAVLAK